MGHGRINFNLNAAETDRFVTREPRKTFLFNETKSLLFPNVFIFLLCVLSLPQGCCLNRTTGELCKMTAILALGS